MSFSNHARRVRDASLPFGSRVSSLRSCAERYQPLGWQATLGFLEEVAGRYQHDEDALLRALDVLDRSRRARSAAHREYAERRRREKHEGRRVPRRDDPDPAGCSWWFGEGARPAALHALRHESRPAGRVAEVRASPASGARDLTLAVDAFLTAGGDLPEEQRRRVAELVERTSRQVHSRDPTDYRIAGRMLWIANLLVSAGEEPARVGGRPAREPDERGPVPEHPAQ